MAFTIIVFSVVILIYSIYYKVWLNPGSNLIQLYTPWGENLDYDNILQDHPRPQYQRDSYINLNGKWKYALRDKGVNLGDEYDGDIYVPFSIESPLSGVGKSLKPGMTLFYNRKIDLSRMKNKGKILLNFGAVDQEADVYINEKWVGNHKGGYLSFTFDITEFVKNNLSNVDILVRVFDNLKENGEAYGKQSNPRGNIYYIPTGGIWQTVWIETVPINYLKNVKITPLYDEGRVEFEPECIINDIKKFKDEKIKYTIKNKNGMEIDGEIPITGKSKIELSKPILSWSPEEPNIYEVIFTFGEDVVSSYFAMRKFSIQEDSKKIKRLFLNNKPYFHIGVLDQGYWADGFYTAPTDEALKYDIIKMKEMGFNMLRKHIKVEPMRWYYHCDTLGMIVWQDMVSGGSFYNPVVAMVTPALHISLPDNWYSFFGRGEEESRNTYYRELKEMVLQLYNTPCISTWVPFNEGWGQFDALKAVDFIKELDPTRHIDHASGFHDQNGGDFLSLHIYFGKIDFGQDKNNRVHALSEYGGYSYVEEGHCGSDHHFGYSHYKTKEELNEAFKDLILNGIIPAIPKGLSATVYTQVSDVEDEVNGIMTYDRKIIKFDIDKVKKLNSLIQYLD